MQPRGLGMPAIFAASFAGPFGKSWYSSLMGTPEALPSVRALSKTSGVSIKELYQLFPKGPAKLAAKIAGIPKPRGCI